MLTNGMECDADPAICTRTVAVGHSRPRKREMILELKSRMSFNFKSIACFGYVLSALLSNSNR